VKNAAGFAFFAASNPVRTILLRAAAPSPGAVPGEAISSKMHDTPAFARCAAIREPIVPAPNTATLSMRRFIKKALPARLDRLQNRHSTVKPHTRNPDWH